MYTQFNLQQTLLFTFKLVSMLFNMDIQNQIRHIQDIFSLTFQKENKFCPKSVDI